MSKLYDSIRTLEKKNIKESEIPNFNVTKSKPPYFLFALTFIFVLGAVFSGYLLKKKIESASNNNKFIHQSRVYKKNRPNTFKVVETKNKQQKKIVIKEKKVNKKAKTDIEKKNIEQISVSSNIKKPGLLNQTVNKSLKTAKEKKIQHSLPKREKIINTAGKTEQEKSEFRYVEPKKNIESTAELLNLANSDNTKTAINAYKKLIKRFKNNVSLYNNLAVKYIESKQYYSAIRILRKAMKFSDDDELKLNLVIAYIKIKKIKSAQNIFYTINQNNISNKTLLSELQNYFISLNGNSLKK